MFDDSCSRRLIVLHRFLLNSFYQTIINLQCPISICNITYTIETKNRGAIFIVTGIYLTPFYFALKYIFTNGIHYKSLY